MKPWFAASLATALLAGQARPAAACEAPRTISGASAAGHQYVVKARVFRVRPPVADTGVVPVMFSVMRNYRGAAPQILTVDFDPHDPRPLAFHRGEVYLLSTLPAANGAKDRGAGNACTLRQLVDAR